MNSPPDERYQQSIERLKATHEFPGPVMFKVIGDSKHEFIERVLSVFREMLNLTEDPQYTSRETPNGRHISVTVEPEVPSADDVLSIYARIKELEGVVMVM